MDIQLEPGTEVVIEPGSTYTYVNTGSKYLVLRDTAIPPFQTGDDVNLLPSGSICSISQERPTNPDNCTVVIDTEMEHRVVELPGRFFDLAGQAIAAALA